MNVKISEDVGLRTKKVMQSMKTGQNLHEQIKELLKVIVTYYIYSLQKRQLA